MSRAEYLEKSIVEMFMQANNMDSNPDLFKQLSRSIRFDPSDLVKRLKEKLKALLDIDSRSELVNIIKKKAPFFDSSG